jgi:hypothetical protein
MTMNQPVHVLAGFSGRTRRRLMPTPGWLRPYAVIISAFDYRPRNQYIRGDKAAPGAADEKGWAT